MKNILFFNVLFLSGIFLTKASSVSNVRLVDPRSYAIAMIQKTINRVEQSHWCNLKIDDLKMTLRENVLGVSVSGEIEFTNGFLVSLQKTEILQNTVQQVWLPLRLNTTTVDVRVTMRMLNVVIGFDVAAKMNEKIYLSTATMRYPEIKFPFVITKNLFTDNITVGVSSVLVKPSSLINFSPENNVTKILTPLFDWNSTAGSFRKWATDIFTPITLDIVTNEIEFPRICYDCPVQ